jgi:acetyl-CoA C-acetyltransferase
MNNVVVVSACRTAIGRFGGAFKEVSADELSAVVMREAIHRAGVAPEAIEDVIWGECHQQADKINIARVAALQSGLPISVPGVSVNRVCTSSLQAIIFAAQSIKAGDMEVLLVGGVESMSTAPYVLRKARWGYARQHGEILDTIWEGLTCPSSRLLMGMTAEKLAEKYGISREEQDEVALRSHRNAIAAIDNGFFKEEIVPVTVPKKKGDPVLVEVDEQPRRNLTLADLTKLRPAFMKGGTITAGNACGINDGAAALVLMSSDRAKEMGIKPIARLTAYSCAGVEPELMGYGPVPATQKILDKTGLTREDIDLIEINEAFAAQYLACEKLLGLNREIVNVNGSGVSLGHPVGCTGSRICVTLIHEMRRRQLKKGLATLCGLGGVAAAALFEIDE